MTREAERTADGRYVVVDRRRWRTADPALPDDVRSGCCTTWAPGA